MALILNGYNFPHAVFPRLLTGLVQIQVTVAVRRRIVRFHVTFDAEPEAGVNFAIIETLLQGEDIEEHHNGGAVLVVVVLLLQFTLWVAPELSCTANLHDVKGDLKKVQIRIPDKPRRYIPGPFAGSGR